MSRVLQQRSTIPNVLTACRAKPKLTQSHKPTKGHMPIKRKTQNQITHTCMHWF